MIESRGHIDALARLRETTSNRHLLASDKSGLTMLDSSKRWQVASLTLPAARVMRYANPHLPFLFAVICFMLTIIHSEQPQHLTDGTLRGKGTPR